MGDLGTRPTVVIIGPLPPPAFGVATATELVLSSPVLTAEYRLIHLDTSDRRSVANMGRLDPTNVWLAAKHELLLLRILLAKRPAVTYLTLSQAPLAILRDWIFIRTATLGGSQVVTHLRGSGYAELYEHGSTWLRWVIRNTFRRTNRVLVLGSNLIGMAHSIDDSVIVDVVPNGCPPEEITAASESSGSKGPAQEVLYLGALARSKGLHDALGVAARVAARVPAVRFMFAGQWASDEDRHEADRFVREQGLEANVTFPGPVGIDRKAQLLHSASVYLCASHSEGQPWSILEAMRAGMPVVATNTGAIPDTVVDGVTGFVTEVGDVIGLAEAVTRILEDERLRTLMSQRARQRYDEFFTLERSHTLLREAWDKASNRDTARPPRDTPGGEMGACETSVAAISAVEWFSRNASAFDQQYGTRAEFEEREVLWAHLVDAYCPRGGRVLDAGCGSGALTVGAAALAREVVAVDPSREMLDICARRLFERGAQNCSLLHSRIEDLRPTYLGQFDLVLCSSVIEYVDSPAAVLSVLANLLAADGKLIVSFPNAGSLLRTCERAAYRTIKKPAYYRFVKNVLTATEIDLLFRDAGLTADHQLYFGAPLLPRWAHFAFPSRRVATMTVYVCGRT